MVDSFAINIEAACDDCLFWLAVTLAQIAVRASERGFLFLCQLLLIWYQSIIWI